MAIDPTLLALELADAHADRRIIASLPSAREPALDLPTAYAVEAELARMRLAAGHAAVGRKVGFANRAMWRALKLETLVWAHMYDDTVRLAAANEATLALGPFISPKIEPEIVVKMRGTLDPGATEAAAVLDAVEWVALGFEIIDCAYVDWKFTPADFVASFGLHAGLIVGEPLRVDAGRIPSLVDELASFKLTLSKNGEAVAEGAGKNSLKSPALCVGELARALSRQPGASPLAAGEIVSSGTLTEAQFLVAGDTWTAACDGLDVPPLTVRVA